jgi:DNA-directed DNA polymerase III PolC
MPALALTDYTSLSGAVEFYDACREVGVKPILGLEFDVTPPPGLPRLHLECGRLALLAMDMHGWGSLCRLSSALLTNPAFENNPVFPFERLTEHAAGVVCLSGGWRNLEAGFTQVDYERGITQALGLLAEIFAGRFYVEVEDSDPAKNISNLAPVVQAKRLGLPLVATHSIDYLDPKEAPLQQVVTAIRLNCRLEQVPAGEQAAPGAYFLSPDEMSSRFAEFPEALAATQEIAERCRLELPLGRPHYPEIPLPPGATPEQVLRQRAEDGAQRLYSGITAEIQSRLDHELEMIAECGYSALFLVMEEILQHARRIGVPFSSRGSAASSLVAHCLGITSPDPLRLNLYFERFLNPARATPPDIDTDLCSRRRDEVIRFVYEHYSEERVAMVCTINRYRRRSALRDVAKAYNLPAAEIDKLVEALPQRWYGPPPPGYREGTAFDELSQRYRSARHQAVFRDAAALLDKPRHLSIHPGGVVIAPGRLTDLVPTLLASKGVVITQFDLDAIERLGLVKIDLLGIRGLTVLGDVAQTLQAAYPGKYASSLDALDSIPQDDPPTSELVQHGRTIGCFQIESPGMRATLKEIQARSLDDLMVALALYRPGPLTGGLKDDFVHRHRGEKEAAQLHPALGPLLEDTYGVILYQEQVLRIAHELGGFSLADADLLRRAMSHFDPGKQMQTLKEKFIAGALERGGVPPDVAERVWELMAAFAGYGFPKAHAASYAQVAWQSAWCKAHHPAVFMAAVLANWGGYYGQRVYLTEARRMGLALRPPHVNFARREFSVDYQQGRPVLYMGLNQVRDLTRRTIERIQRLRPFTSLEDFLRRADPRPVEAENLARAGALQGFGTIPGLLHRLKGESQRSGQLSLFVLEDQAEDWSLEERVAAQETILGVGVDAHPLELVKDQIAAAGALNTLEAAEQVGQKVRVAGMRQTWRRFATARGDYIYYMSLEDLEGMLDVVISSRVYQRCRLVLKEPGPYIVEGLVERDAASGEPFIRAGNIGNFS